MKNKPCISDKARQVNFREIRCGKIAPGLLYRSSHPIEGYGSSGFVMGKDLTYHSRKV